MVSIGWSDFARKQHTPKSGNSYTLLRDEELLELIRSNWELRIPGMGEGSRIDRKVLVPIQETSKFHTPPYVEPKLGLNVRAKLVQRQEGEAPYVQTYITWDDAKEQNCEVIFPNPKSVNIVCYSAEALLENGGQRSTDCDWEIVAILASSSESEPMQPLTMSRNFLEKEGGTKGFYTAQEFAEAIWYWSTKKGITVKDMV